MQLDESQARAVALATTAKIACLTGGPGTGKSTTVRAVLDAIPGAAVELASPTGKAARRLAQTTGRSARTLHRLLEYRGTGFDRCALFPVEADLVVVDESSMLDVELADALFSALADETRLLLVGDANQLPSVGPGRVFADMIDSGEVPVARLDQVHRAAAESWVCSQAPKFLRGEAPDLKSRADFGWMPTPKEQLAAQVLDIVITVEKATGALPPVLVPMNPGPAGVDALNATIQARVNPRRRGELAHGKAPGELRPRDPVMQTRNDYLLGVFNGETGVVVSIDEAGKVAVAFDERVVEYSKGQASALRLAYALTIHKSQGSEWPWIVVVCHSTHTYMLSRQLIYTAITRAKKGVVLVGDEAGLERALKNVAPSKRNTSLTERLRGAA